MAVEVPTNLFRHLISKNEFNEFGGYMLDSQLDPSYLYVAEYDACVCLECAGDAFWSSGSFVCSGCGCEFEEPEPDFESDYGDQ